ncbi:protein PML isoform X4 [Delphinus delphis]|uniref:protein PML isoform X4 n=1 Tax=Delphinus delphis TaxID=9728 RepID=UPI0028C38E72|nr:protein PML isoform X4 [Delphinus delphis]
MQQEPKPAGSPGPQQDPALPHAPTMPPPESLSEGHEHSHSPTEQATEEEFQFLHCQGCRAEAKCPKLLPCLHTLCSGCLEEPGRQCPICQAPWPPGPDVQALDNVFFEGLQWRLHAYRQIMDAQALCIRCKELADYWCFECKQLLCAKCIEAHRWFLKHEDQPLAELRSQSAREFLDDMRKSNNIFCSNPNHRDPTLTSIYCRGCSKPLCCSCALLDRGHSELKCDIRTEIQQRQEELDVMTQDLQEQDRAFGAAQAQITSAVNQLGRVRADIEEQIRAGVRQVVEHVLDQERQLLEELNAGYQRNYEEIAGQLGRLDAVLQRIRTGSMLVQRMKLYASDQEMLDMHGFLREALHQLRQEEPQSLRAAVRTDSFDEFKVRLQDLVSRITQGTDAAVNRRASPEAARTPRDTFDVDPPEEAQRAQVQAPGLTVVQPVPGAHPVPVYAYSIKDPSCREEVSNTATPQKRKSCQTECPRKVIKMESEEEKESRLARSSPEQPRPSTSKAVSPPHLDRSPSPKTPVIGNETFLPDSNHATSDPGEAEERVVVISSSEDSDAENSSKLPSLMLCVPDSLPLTRSKLPSTVGSTSYHAEHKETRAFAISYACPSECIVPPCGLVLPPKGQSRPPPRPPPGLPANLPVPRSVPPASQRPTANPAGRDGQHDPAAAPSGAPRAWPSGSTTSLPFRSPLWLPNLMPLSGWGSGEAEHPRLLEQESLLGTLAEPPWRIPKSRSHWKSLQMHSHHPTLQIGLPRARAPRRQASESPSASLLCSPDPGHLPLVTLWPTHPLCSPSPSTLLPSPAHAAEGPTHSRHPVHNQRVNKGMNGSMDLWVKRQVLPSHGGVTEIQALVPHILRPLCPRQGSFSHPLHLPLPHPPTPSLPTGPPPGCKPDEGSRSQALAGAAAQ